MGDFKTMNNEFYNDESEIEEQDGIDWIPVGRMDDFFIDDFEDCINMEDGSTHSFRTVDLNKAFEDEKKSEQESLMELIKIILNMISRIDVDKLIYVVDVLEENLPFVKHCEDVRKGRITPAKKDVLDVDIEIDYADGLSCRQISEKYGSLSEDAIRKRLKKLGVYKSKSSKNTKN